MVFERVVGPLVRIGLVACLGGGCRAERPPDQPELVAMRWDLSLHQRHVAAEDEECDRCHHVWDEDAGELVYEEETEAACAGCHGAKDEGRRLSLERASHRACVGCHEARGEGGGPTDCAGCHTAAAQARIRRLEDVPRLDRGQPDETWLHSRGAKAPEVRFDHARHEPRARLCSTCHHRTLEACSACHTVAGSPDGGGVRLGQAYHAADSDRGCVGCHRTATAARECAGCHHTRATAPQERTCGRCHTGREPPTPPPPPGPADLPPASDDFPESLALAADERASVFPHARVVAALAEVVRKSPLAGRFHGGPEALCAGCHHHAPLGERPAPCRACHGDSPAATVDRPDDRAAYHRQCLGCHRQMGIERVGCTDCHAAREVRP